MQVTNAIDLLISQPSAGVTFPNAFAILVDRDSFNHHEPLKKTHLPPLSQLEEEHCAARLITLRAAAVICVRHLDSDGDVLLGFAKS